MKTFKRFYLANRNSILKDPVFCAQVFSSYGWTVKQAMRNTLRLTLSIYCWEFKSELV